MKNIKRIVIGAAIWIAAGFWVNCQTLKDSANFGDISRKIGGAGKKSSSPSPTPGKYSHNPSANTAQAQASEPSPAQSSSPAVFANNLLFGVTDERGTLTERPVNTFKPGQWVHAINRKTSKDLQSRYNNKDVTVILNFGINGKNIAVHSSRRKVDSVENDLYNLNILPDPNSTSMKSQRWDWSGKLAAALGKLSGGEHEILVTGFLESGRDRDQFVQGNFIYNNKDGNGNMAQYAGLIEKNRSFDIMKENEEFSKKHGRAADNIEQIKTTVRNNCGHDVVITFANQASSSINIKLYYTQTLPITVNEGESIYVSWKGKSAYNGPTIGSFEKGKIVNICN